MAGAPTKGGVTRGSVTEQLKAIKNEPGSDDERGCSQALPDPD